MMAAPVNPPMANRAPFPIGCLCFFRRAVFIMISTIRSAAMMIRPKERRVPTVTDKLKFNALPVKAWAIRVNVSAESTMLMAVKMAMHKNSRSMPLRCVER